MANRDKINSDFKSNRTKFREEKYDGKRQRKERKHKETHKRDFLEVDDKDNPPDRG